MDWQTAIFGPGWFWSMLGVVLVVGSLIGLYRQLRLQSSQAAVEQIRVWTDDWGSERYIRYKLDILAPLLEGVDPAQLPQRSATVLENHWETIGALTRAGNLDRKLLWNTAANASQFWWGVLSPSIRRRRPEEGAVLGEHFEWLAELMAEMDRRSGVPISADFARQMSTESLEQFIADLQYQLQIERTLRTVSIASPAATAGEESTAGPGAATG